MKKVEEKRLDVNSAVGMGEAILSVCHPDCVTTIKHWITIIRARFEEVSRCGDIGFVSTESGLLWWLKGFLWLIVGCSAPVE